MATEKSTSASNIFKGKWEGRRERERDIKMDGWIERRGTLLSQSTFLFLFSTRVLYTCKKTEKNEE
jgi:hypothetical protein